MSLFDWLYISKERAIQNGCTHEGTLFGAPAWMKSITDEELFAAPKIPVLVYYVTAAAWLFALAHDAIQILTGRAFDARVPISVKGPINPDDDDGSGIGV